MKIEFGEPISPEWSKYLNTFKYKGDIKEIAEKHNYNPITLTAIVNRYRNITESNAPMVIDLFSKCISHYKEMQEIKEGVNDIIEEIQ